MVNFFEAEPARLGTWQVALRYHLVESPTPLLISLVGGFAHPFLLLADAIELGSSTLAMDSLALAAVDYSPLSKLLEATLPESTSTDFDPSALLREIRQDQVFEGLIQSPGIQNLRTLLTNKEALSAIAKYLSRLSFVGGQELLLSQFLDLAVNLLTCTHVPGGDPAFDFFLNHVLSFCNCVRILLPVFPEPHKAMLFRILWLMTILPYITQQRPTITPSLLDETEAVMSGDEIRRKILEGSEERTKDPHFVKAVQLLIDLPSTWPDKAPRFLKAANKLVAQFQGWRGFGAANDPPLNL